MESGADQNVHVILKIRERYKRQHPTIVKQLGMSKVIEMGRYCADIHIISTHVSLLGDNEGHCGQPGATASTTAFE